jgi:hypothetical protein
MKCWPRPNEFGGRALLSVKIKDLGRGTLDELDTYIASCDAVVQFGGLNTTLRSCRQTALSLAFHMQAVLQGAFILAKAKATTPSPGKHPSPASLPVQKTKP